MEASVSIQINATVEKVWQCITDIENAGNMISGIKAIQIIDKPASGLVGLKWQESREMFGKEASEIMWITEAEENQFYCTRAESHGSIYITKLALEKHNEQTFLKMTFTGLAQSFLAKVMSFLMGPLINSSIKKALQKDLEDIKTFVEKRG